MDPITNQPPPKPDLGILAIQAAGELERLRVGDNTDLKAVNELYKMLQESFSANIEESGGYLRFDYLSVFSKAHSNSLYSTVPLISTAVLINEATHIAEMLNPDTIKSREIEELAKLVSFCVALSDSATLYNEELIQLRKHFAAS